MKECSMETKTVAHFLDPHSARKEGLWQQLDAIEQSCLVGTLRHNKVAMNFKERLDQNVALTEKLFTTFPQAKALYEDMNLKNEKDAIAFRKIRRDFAGNDIEFMLIKSDGYFPYESDNIDILIYPTSLGGVVRLLKEANYSEIPETREPHKYLFRKTRTPDVLPLHVHTRVEWEGTQFADSDCLWRRSKISSDFDGYRVPSPEDCILITSAHLFFENHEIRLADLLKIDSKLKERCIDWTYVFEQAERLHWNDAFCLTMLLVDLVHKDLFGNSMLPQRVSCKMEKESRSYIRLFRKTLKTFNSGYSPLAIPYAIVAYFFLKRVFRESDLPLGRRLRHIDWIASNVLRTSVRLGI